MLFRLHGEDNIAIKRYVISFWNGVDLRYRLLKGPSVKISIAGIIISRVSYTIWLHYSTSCFMNLSVIMHTFGPVLSTIAGIIISRVSYTI